MSARPPAAEASASSALDSDAARSAAPRSGSGTLP
jgi:hypothetical protein